MRSALCALPSALCSLRFASQVFRPMAQHTRHNLRCRPIIFNFKGLHHLFVEAEHHRGHRRINKKLAGKIDIALFKGIEQQRIDVIPG